MITRTRKSFISMGSRFLAASCAHLGRLDEAGQAIEQLSALGVSVMPPYRHAGMLRSDEVRELLFSGLRLAMDEAE